MRRIGNRRERLTLAFVAILPALCVAEDVLLWDSRATNAPPATSMLCIDIGVTDVERNPLYRSEYRMVREPLPGIYDTSAKTYAAWTGSGTGTVAALDVRGSSRQRKARAELRTQRAAAGASNDTQLVRALLERSTAQADRDLARVMAAIWLREKGREDEP